MDPAAAMATVHVSTDGSTDDVAWLDPTEMAAWIGFIKVAARIVALSDAELRRTRAITGRDYELLHHLSSSPDGWRVNELAEVIHDSSSCITHRVNRLCAAGLVDKRPDATDQRAKRVRLTRAGRRLLDQTAPEHVAWVRRTVIDPLDHRDLTDLARITASLDAHLRAMAPEAD